ncbi:MAG: hypothetical protein CL862_12705 [Cyanobium sp. NAT70]|nr:hypothetical protein [Cyanobium sp. NAT70]
MIKFSCSNLVHGCCVVLAFDWVLWIDCSLLCWSWPLRFEVSSVQAMGRYFSKLVKRGALLLLG